MTWIELDHVGGSTNINLDNIVSYYTSGSQIIFVISSGSTETLTFISNDIAESTYTKLKKISNTLNLDKVHI